MGGATMDSGEGGSRALSQADRAAFSAALLKFLDELEPLIRAGFGEEVAGSRAEQLAKGSYPSRSQGPYPGRNALETVLFATLAGIDHSRLLARSLLREDAAFSIATLARGAVESYARAWWMIEPQDDEELVVRWLSALASELGRYGKVRPDAVLHEMRGRNSNAATELIGVLDDIERITGSRIPREVRYTAMAASLADSWGANGRIVYSDLSGVAHGESLGIHAFVEADDNASAYRVGLSGRWGLTSAQWVLRASASVSREVLKILGREVHSSHPCAVAHDDAARVILSARTHIFGTDTATEN